MFAYFLSYEWGWADELFTYTFCSEFGSAVHNTLEEYANSKGTADYFKVYNKYVAELKPFAKDMNKAPSKARALHSLLRRIVRIVHSGSLEHKYALLWGRVLGNSRAVLKSFMMTG
jgi:hypothetical protein